MIDFFHVSHYLAAAAPKVAREGKEHQWLHRQQGRLLNEQVHKVLRSLEKHQEPPAAVERPVADAYHYLQERREQERPAKDGPLRIDKAPVRCGGKGVPD